MEPRIKNLLDEAKLLMEKAISHTDSELLKIRAGKANPTMLDGLYIDYYGTNTALGQVASINSPDARTIVVQPWEKNLIGAIERAIQEANLGLNPQNDGSLIRINIPALTDIANNAPAGIALAAAAASKAQAANPFEKLFLGRSDE